MASEQKINHEHTFTIHILWFAHLDYPNIIGDATKAQRDEVLLLFMSNTVCKYKYELPYVWENSWRR